MKKTDISRRDFHRLTTAALGGAVAGALLGCESQQRGGPRVAATDGDNHDEEGHDDHEHEEGHEDHDHPPILEDKHTCRGLNTCKGKGADEKNACAGQGACAVAQAHTCHAANDCKGQGGCGSTAGQNECKGKGECAVPLSDTAWKKARAAFETAMNEDKWKFGEAPAK